MSNNRSKRSSPTASSLSLEELFGEIMFSSLITRSDRQRLLQALDSDSLNEDETAIIQRVLYNIRRGWIRLVDDSSRFTQSF
ncbi:MAG: hypothetical protein WBA77_18590 [Microcoleaceae cyanobacterium]